MIYPHSLHESTIHLEMQDSVGSLCGAKRIQGKIEYESRTERNKHIDSQLLNKTPVLLLTAFMIHL